MAPRTYKLTLAYDGTPFCGWQIQPNGLSVQECLEKAIAILTKEKVRVVGSGRTDAGVHAKGQVAHVICEHLPPLPPALLPKEIRILSIDEVDSSFHAQYGAKSKTYHYNLWLEKSIDPFVRKYRHHIYTPLNVDLLESAAQLFVGTHDFTTFANVGTPTNSYLRTIYRIDVVAQEGGIRLEFEGSGFLYKMVRNITGTLLSVAKGALPLCEIPTLFEAKDRRAAPPPAPAKGLFLMQVNY